MSQNFRQPQRWGRGALWCVQLTAAFWLLLVSSTGADADWEPRAQDPPVPQAFWVVDAAASDDTSAALGELYAPATPAHSLVVGALGFVAGVLCALLVIVCVLPSAVRYHCAETVRRYNEFVKPDATPRVIVVDRGGAAQLYRDVGSVTNMPAHHGPPSADVMRRIDPADSGPTRGSPTGIASERPIQDNAILQRIYEQNLQLRERLASGTCATTQDDVPNESIVPRRAT